MSCQLSTAHASILLDLDCQHGKKCRIENCLHSSVRADTMIVNYVPQWAKII